MSMEDISSYRIKELPLKELQWVNDLIYYDGPFLSQLKRRDNEYYLKLWCDCNENYNRWMYFNIYEKDRLRLLAGEKSLYDCLIEQPNSFVFFSDESTDNTLTYMVDNENIPNSYLPEVDSILILDDSLIIEDNSAFIFEDDWDMDSLRDLYKKFTQVFNFNYLLSKQTTVIANFPWQDGASFKHFYDRLSNSLPNNVRCNLDSVIYASPGFMKISCDRDLNYETLGRVDDYINNRENINSAYLDLAHEIRANSLNQMSFENAVINFDNDTNCLRHLNRLSELLLSQSERDWFMNRFECNFIRAKVLMGHKRRINDLAEYFISGSVRSVSKLINLT